MRESMSIFADGGEQKLFNQVGGNLQTYATAVFRFLNSFCVNKFLKRLTFSGGKMSSDIDPVCESDSQWP